MKKMKMNLFALIAVGIAAVTMSFQLATNNVAQDTVWFLMNEAGTQVTNIQTDDPDSDCPHQLTPNCAREYELSQTEPAPGGGIRVKASEVNNYIDFRGKN